MMRWTTAAGLIGAALFVIGLVVGVGLVALVGFVLLAFAYAIDRGTDGGNDG
jgi:hypothetical protein